MAGNVSREATSNGDREIALELGSEVPILRQIGGQQLSIQRNLRVRQHYRELRSRQADALLATRSERLLVG